MAFRTSVPVRFGDVDHAGIVFYPKFFVYFHEAFERFFDDARITYERLIGERRLGFPTVHIDCDYKAPLRYGDSLDLELSVPRVGNRSATFRYAGYRHRDGMHAVTAEITCACVDMDKFQALEIPADLRAFFARFAT